MASVSLLTLFIYLGSTGNFMSHEMFGKIGNFRQAHKGILLGSVFLVFFGMLLISISIIATYQRKMPWYLNLCQQISLFFFLFVPFAAQASTM